MIRRITLGFGAPLVIASVLSCSSGPQSPASPTASPGTVSPVASDGSNIKATPPVLLSPSDGEREVAGRPTLVFQNATGTYVGIGFIYETQLLNPSGQVMYGAVFGQGNRITSHEVQKDLGKENTVNWRVRARLPDENGQPLFGPWSKQSSFVTKKENRTPDPGPGQQLPLPNMAAIVQQVAAQNPNAVRNSCQDAPGGSWEFMDLVVDALRAFDTRWGYNCKRGNCPDYSLDVIDYHWGPGPDEGSPDVYAIDVLLGHCGPNPTPTWIDITNPFGSGAKWTSRGRF